MSSHYERQGFQRAFLNDPYHVNERLQEYDEHLYVMWNPTTGEHLIVDGLIGLSVMKIPQRGFPFLTGNLVDHIRKIHTANGFSASAHIEESDRRRERENQRIQEDLAQDFAKEMKEAGRNAFDYGIVDGKRKYVQVTK